MRIGMRSKIFVVGLLIVLLSTLVVWSKGGNKLNFVVLLEKENVLPYVDNDIYSIKGYLVNFYSDTIKDISKNKLTIEQIDSILKASSKVSKIFDIPLHVLLGMIAQESNFIVNANSFLGASYGRGLMQVSEIALKDFNNKMGYDYKPKDLYDPEINLIVGCWIYLNNINYGVDNKHSHLIIAYNCGHKTYKDEKNFLLSAKRKDGSNYNHLNKVLAYIEEFDRVSLNYTTNL
jgi:soluble lytic murein transglycosylase-like protein